MFLRALGCVSTQLRAACAAGDCKGFKPATGGRVRLPPARHAASRPIARIRNRDDVNLASLGRLESSLDRLQRGGRLRATTRRFNLFLDEYGYQTRPPDRTAGVSLATQDRWLQRAAYRAWRDPRVRLLTQYQWYDEPLRRAGSAFAGWQSGLRFLYGRAKPALAHFDTPMQVDAARSRLWGQVRPGGAQAVTVERRLRGAKRYGVIARVAHRRARLLDAQAAAHPGARYRFRTAAATSASFRR